MRKKDDSYVKFEIPIDPEDPNGLKSTMQFMKLSSDEPEDVLTHLRTFNKLVTDLDTEEGPAMFRLFNLTLTSDMELDWNTVLEEIGDGREQEDFENAKELFLLSKVERDCALSTKEWLFQIRKPRTMTVKKFVQRIKQINNLFPFMPLPEEDSDEEDRIQAFTEAEIRNILKKACPRSWRETQEKSNIRFDSISAQVQYYEKLSKIDDKHFNKKEKPEWKNGKKQNQTSKPDNYNPKAPCPIHGKAHSISECGLINQEKKKIANKNNGQNKSNGSEKNRNKKYVSKRKTEKEKNQENHSNDVESDAETNYEIEEELNIIHQNVNKPNKGSDVRVQLQNQSGTKNG